MYGYFDPSGYLTFSSSEKVKIERQLKQKCKEQNQYASSNITSSTTAPSTSECSTQSTNRSFKSINEKSNRLNKFLKSIDKNVQIDKSKPKTISEEIAYYGYLCRQISDLDALNFWRLYGEQMPMLKAMARQYLATPSTSVPSESAFSSSAYVARKERSRLSIENLAHTIFLQDKLRLLD